MADRAKGFRTRGSLAVKPRKKRAMLEGRKRTWSRRFIDLAGSARGFPYPAEPRPVEAAPDLA